MRTGTSAFFVAKRGVGQGNKSGGGRISYGMNISDLKKGMHAVVWKVEQPAPMRERLRFLGVYAGAKITVLKVSLFKRSYLVQAGSAKVALGREVAEGVRVWQAK